MATRYWVGGGSSANWNATGNTNWGTASGVQDNASVPTSVDDVIFDGAGAGGNTSSTISATITVKSLTINAGYTATMTHNAVLTIAGNWTMSNTHTIAGSSDITINGGGTINTNSQAWPNNISIISGFGAIITLTSNFVCNGTTSCTQQTVAINRTASETWSTAGLTVTVSSNNALSGTAEIILTGGTWSGSGIVNNNLTINGNVTISGSIGYHTGTLKYTSGTVTTTGSTLNLQGGTLNTNGITWNNVSITSGFGAIITLTSNFTCSGTTSCTQQTVIINKTNSETWTTVGLNVTVASNNALSGTAEIILTGGTWSGSGIILNNLTISGNVTISGVVGYNAGLLKYTSGVITTTGSTLTLKGGSVSLNTNGIIWNNVDITSGFGTTITLLSNFTCTGTTNCLAGSISINQTTSEKWYSNGLTLTGVGIGGSSEIILTGGIWSGGVYTVTSNLTFAGNVTVSGNVYYNTRILKYTSGTVTTTGSTLNITGACTLNANGITWNNITITTPNTITLTSNFVCSGTTVISSLVKVDKTTSETWSTAGLTVNTSQYIAGSTSPTAAEVILTGGTWSGTGTVISPLTFAGNVTVSGTVTYARLTMKYTSGTITTTGSTLSLIEACTLNTNGITWNNVITGVAVTLTSNFTCTGSTTVNGNFDPNKSTSETWSTAGLLANTGRVGGTAEIILTGGTWSCGANILVYNPLTFAGNVTVSGTVNYRRNTLKYTSGTITTTGSILSVTGESIVFDTNGINWGNVIIGVNVTINSLLNVTNTLTLEANTNIAFSGTSGWTCATLLNASTGFAAINLKDGNTYTVTGALNAFQSRNASSISITSSSASLRANLVLLAGATCNCLANLTRIDASGGRPIYTFNGTVTDCLNVKSFNDLTTIASSYVNL